MKLWIIILTIIVIVEGRMISDLMERVENFESWYPFCELLKSKFYNEDDED